MISWIKDTSPYFKLILTWIGLTFRPHLASLSKTKRHGVDSCKRQYLQAVCIGCINLIKQEYDTTSIPSPIRLFSILPFSCASVCANDCTNGSANGVFSCFADFFPPSFKGEGDVFSFSTEISDVIFAVGLTENSISVFNEGFVVGCPDEWIFVTKGSEDAFTEFRGFIEAFGMESDLLTFSCGKCWRRIWHFTSNFAGIFSEWLLFSL